MACIQGFFLILKFNHPSTLVYQSHIVIYFSDRCLKWVLSVECDILCTYFFQNYAQTISKCHSVSSQVPCPHFARDNSKILQNTFFS
jgi:hypothetical protein